MRSKEIHIPVFSRKSNLVFVENYESILNVIAMEGNLSDFTVTLFTDTDKESKKKYFGINKVEFIKIENHHAFRIEVRSVSLQKRKFMAVIR